MYNLKNGEISSLFYIYRYFFHEVIVMNNQNSIQKIWRSEIEEHHEHNPDVIINDDQIPVIDLENWPQKDDNRTALTNSQDFGGNEWNNFIQQGYQFGQRSIQSNDIIKHPNELAHKQINSFENDDFGFDKFFQQGYQLDRPLVKSKIRRDLDNFLQQESPNEFPEYGTREAENFLQHYNGLEQLLNSGYSNDAQLKNGMPSAFHSESSSSTPCDLEMTSYSSRDNEARKRYSEKQKQLIIEQFDKNKEAFLDKNGSEINEKISKEFGFLCGETIPKWKEKFELREKLSKFNDQERLETLQKYREIQKLKPYLSIKQIASMMPKDEGKLLPKDVENYDLFLRYKDIKKDHPHETDAFIAITRMNINPTLLCAVKQKFMSSAKERAQLKAKGAFYYKRAKKLTQIDPK